MKAKRISGLYAITPDASSADGLLPRVKECLKGGARIVQYRNKVDSAPHLEIASTLAVLCRQYEAVFIVNDDVELAVAAGADGVHLGREDGDIALARRQLGPEGIIGVSCYGSLEHALFAQLAGADYVAFGSVFASPTKPQAPHIPLSLLTEARSQLDIPVVAIGGITLQNAAQVVASGADAIAVISAVFDTPDVAGAAQNFSNFFN
jgi:thiamine-phosphate pyrophosphorylase